MFKRIFLTIVFILIGLAAITIIVLESGQVLVVETKTGSGQEKRETHIWLVQSEGRLLLEAGTPENPRVLDLAIQQALMLKGEGLDGMYRFKLHGPASHENIRRLMEEKYGWRDWWISMIFDTSRSFMIEVVPVAV